MPRAAPSRCTMPRCTAHATHKARCEQHQHDGWEHKRRQDKREDRSASARTGQSSTEWQKTWGTVMREHDRTCHVCGRANADQIDHIIPIGLGGARKDRNNLAPIHKEPCHRKKTAAELLEMKRLKKLEQAKKNLADDQKSFSPDSKK